MIEIPYYDSEGKAKDPIQVDPAAFGDRIRYRLLKEAVLMFEANQRQGTHSTKTRAEVAATSAKPWRQKGTGRARAGSAASPIWRGGGVAHGPRPRNYGWTMPKKKRRLALKSAILAKLQDGEVRCVEDLPYEEPKTSRAAKLLAALGLDGKCLVGTADHSDAVYKSFRNIPKVKVSTVANFNPHGVIDGGVILLTKAALDQLIAGPASGEASDEGGNE